MRDKFSKFFRDRARLSTIESELKIILQKKRWAKAIRADKKSDGR